MHIDYAVESLIGMESPKHSAPLSPQSIVEALVAEKEFLALALSLGDAKIASIAESVKSAENNRYKKVTHAQKHALAAALLAKHGTARAVYAAAFGVSQTHMFGEEIASAVVAPAALVAPAVQAERIEAAQKAAVVANFLGLPALAGTDKQKTWAEQIRAEAIQGLETTHPEELARLLDSKTAKLASYWIDCRMEIRNLLND